MVFSLCTPCTLEHNSILTYFTKWLSSVPVPIHLLLITEIILITQDCFLKDFGILFNTFSTSKEAIGTFR